MEAGHRVGRGYKRMEYEEQRLGDRYRDSIVQCHLLYPSPYYDDLWSEPSVATMYETKEEICDVIKHTHTSLCSRVPIPGTIKIKKISRRPKPIPQLHIAIMLAMRDDLFNKEEIYLPDICQILLNAGADVNETDQHRLTPLAFLLVQVRFMITRGRLSNVYTVEYHKAIAETVRILLHAGADPSAGIDGMRAIYILADLSPAVHPAIARTYAWSDPNYILMVLEILASLMPYEPSSGSRGTAVNDKVAFCFRHILQFIDIGRVLERHANKMINDLPTDPYFNVMEKLAKIFRVHLLSAKRFNGSFNNWDVLLKPYDRFLTEFASIANYSIQPGRSTSLIRLVLCSLSVTQIREIKALLTARMLPCARFTNALKWLSDIETPFSLKHLSRLAIHRSMSSGALLSVPTLGLPRCMQDYVLMSN